MKLFRLVVPILAGLAMAAGTFTALAHGQAAPATPPAPIVMETDLALAGGSGGAENMHVDGMGKLWISQDSDVNAYVRAYDPATHAYTDYTGLESPNDAQLGPDGNVWWYQDTPTDSLARMDLASGTVTTWSVPAFAPVSEASLAFDSSNNVWALETAGSNLVSFDPISNTLCTLALPNGSGGPFLTEHNGALWLGLTDAITPGLARITATTNDYTFWPLDATGFLATPGGVSFGPNGDIWFSDDVSGTIGRLETGANRVTLFNPPGGYSPPKVEYFLGKVWFTGQIGDGGIGAIGFLDPATATGTTPLVVTPTTATLGSSCVDAGAGIAFTAGISTGVSVFSPTPLTATVDAQGSAYQMPISSKPEALERFGSNLWVLDQARNKLVDVVITTTLYLPFINR